MTRDEVMGLLNRLATFAAVMKASEIVAARDSVSALYAERDALLTVREVLKRECEALKAEIAARDADLSYTTACATIRKLKAENTRLRQALKTLHKNPDDCTDPDDGLCVSHAAYLELVEQIEAVGWRWDDSLDRWVSPLNGEDHE